MTSAPATGCCSATLASKASAGGQLEQPSDVNNSKTTGTRSAARLEAAGAVCVEPAWLIAARATARARTSDGKIEFSFIATRSWGLYILRLPTVGGPIVAKRSFNPGLDEKCLSGDINRMLQ